MARRKMGHRMANITFLGMLDDRICNLENLIKGVKKQEFSTVQLDWIERVEKTSHSLTILMFSDGEINISLAKNNHTHNNNGPAEFDWEHFTNSDIVKYLQILSQTWSSVLDIPMPSRTPYRKKWKINGDLHRVGGPSIIYVDSPHYSVSEWFRRGFLHRIDGPAIKFNLRDDRGNERISKNDKWYVRGTEIHGFDLIEKSEKPLLEYIKNNPQFSKKVLYLASKNKWLRPSLIRKLNKLQVFI